MNLRHLYVNEKVRMEFFPGKGNPLVIEDKNIVIGYIWFNINNKNEMFIEMVEVIEKGKGIGKNVVEFLFYHFNLTKITGYIEWSPWNGAYSFWTSLNASLELDEEELKGCYYGEQIYFELLKESIFSYV